MQTAYRKFHSFELCLHVLCLHHCEVATLSFTKHIVVTISYSIDENNPIQDEPKFIVFQSMLVALFSLFCFKCGEKKPTLELLKYGTMAKVTQACRKCKEEFTWSSQPLVLGQIPAGNILLSFATLGAGASISKVLHVFKHMGVCCYTARTFFKHQKKFLFPTVLSYWDGCREKLLAALRPMKNLTWSGDGRFDSMGHNAKYGIYSMFCSSNSKIVHFELLQVCSHFPLRKRPAFNKILQA